MPPPRKSAKQKLNAAHLHGAILIAGLLGGISGSWTVFWITLGVLIVTGFHDGTIRR